MKITLLTASIIGAFSISGAVAGPYNYCPPPAKSVPCPVDCCEDLSGHVAISYMSDYIFRGVRYSRDTVGLTASYSFDQCCQQVKIGVNHYSSLGAGHRGNYLGHNGDQTDIFAVVGLPSLCGFDLSLRYDHYLYANARTPGGNGFLGNERTGDSHGALGMTITREIFCGLNFSYTAAYDFQGPSAQAFGNANVAAIGAGNGIIPNNLQDHGAWIHTLALNKSYCITDCVGLDLSAGLLYTDNVWQNGSGGGSSAGWNNYFIEAALPIIIGRCATLTPYIGYNGTPDTWMADDIYNGMPSGNRNDVFHGGIRLGVDF
ncbi:MAG: hypothetical protein P1V20_28980 [Verrucomicrobiales bacterium]|nr:hypothetical protein [Verrucomicrobiales bacterium]